MKGSNRMLSMAMLALLVGACATGPVPPGPWPDMEGAQRPETNRMIGGQPAPHELVAAERAGVRHVVNARDIGEFAAWDEGRLVESLGMQYHRVPIGGPDDLNIAAVNAFDLILAKIGNQAALLHCASGNRIGALYALRAGWVEGKDIETAVAIGKAHGLRGLEAQVREKLAGQ